MGHSVQVANRRVAKGSHVVASLKELINSSPLSLSVGVVKSQTHGDTTTATIYRYMEEGTSRAPARPTLALGVKNGVNTMAFRKALQHHVARQASGYTASQLLGDVLARAVKKEIEQIQQPALSPVTIKLKGSSKPLIHTRKLINSISWKVS